jgi:hypothetical protein
MAMANDGVPAVGTSIVLSLDGQKVTGKVTAVQADKLVVRLTILQPAKAYQGVRAKSILPDGQEVSFDLGSAAYYSELLIEVPLPIGTRVAVTPRPLASTPGSLVEPTKPEPGAVPTPMPPMPSRDRLVEALAKTALSAQTDLAPPPAAAATPSKLEEALLKPALNIVETTQAPLEPVATPKPAVEKPVDERRHFFRFAVNCPVDVVENVGHTREYVREEGRTMNLSGGGMLAEFDKPLPPGTYRFRLQLPEETMLLTGRIIKKGQAPGRVAPIEFVDLHEAERSKLIRFIFNMMRSMRQTARGFAKDDDNLPDPKTDKPKEKAYWRRREKYFKSSKIRYW